MTTDSTSHPKRAAAAVLLSHVKNPIKFVRELLLHGDDDLPKPHYTSGAQGHCCIGGEAAESLARKWGLEMVEPKYFFTQKRYDQHRRGLKEDKDDEGSYHDLIYFSDDVDIMYLYPLADSSSRNGVIVGDNDDDDLGWDGKEYLPQGTVGCVALDQYGTIVTATSTGGLTNKMPGRIGDTPTIGAGFWAEEWDEDIPLSSSLAHSSNNPSHIFDTSTSTPTSLVQNLLSSFITCLPVPPTLSLQPIDNPPHQPHATQKEQTYKSSEPHTTQTQTASTSRPKRYALALSGTGNGDTFLRLCAARSTGSIVRYSPSLVPLPLPLHPTSPMIHTSPSPTPLSHFTLPPQRTLASAITQICGPLGEMQRSAGSRWDTGTGEGEGGMIGIEFISGGSKSDAEGDGEVEEEGDGYGDVGGEGEGTVVFDFNCGGMFRCYEDPLGKVRVEVFK